MASYVILHTAPVYTIRLTIELLPRIERFANHSGGDDENLSCLARVSA